MLDLQGIGELFLGLGVMINAVMAAATWLIAWHASRTIKLLEINTNSIKDALIKTTGEAEHAKGMLAGQAEAMNTVKIAQEQGSKL